MKRTYLILTIGGFMGLLTLLSSCQKDYFVPFDLVLSDVSFSNDIMPIFDASCNMIGCHSSGFSNPYLTADVAYNNLVNGGFINTSIPDSSVLYIRMIGTNGVQSMPLDGALNGGESDYVWQWIFEGALNN